MQTSVAAPSVIIYDTTDMTQVQVHTHTPIHYCICALKKRANMWQRLIRQNKQTEEVRTKGSEEWLTKLRVSKWKSLVSAFDVCWCLRLQALFGLTGLPVHLLHHSECLYLCSSRVWFVYHCATSTCIFSLCFYSFFSFSYLCSLENQIFQLFLVQLTTPIFFLLALFLHNAHILFAKDIIITQQFSQVSKQDPPVWPLLIHQALHSSWRQGQKIQTEAGTPCSASLVSSLYINGQCL